MERFAGEMNKVQQSLSSIREKSASKGPASSGVSPHDELIRAIEEILPHLKKRKPKPSKECMETINGLGWPVSLTTDVTALGKVVARYKFKEALPLAESLLKALAG